MSRTTTTLQVTGLGKHAMAQLVERAGQLGMTPRQYVKHLVSEDLAIAREARTTSFAQLMRPVRTEFERSGMSERELGELVGRARTSYRRQTKRTGR